MDNITVLICSSPIKSHPSTHIIDETIQSVVEHLPGARIVIMQDGVREEQKAYEEAYEQYKVNLINKGYPVDFMILSEHCHQARMTLQALHGVLTPIILFIEHDMPLRGDIPIDDIVAKLLSGDADLIRLLYEDNDLTNFSYMLREKEGDFTQTVQWSGRPHFARTDYYRRILTTYFSPHSKTFIEDHMHGVVDSEENWNNHKLWVYTPALPVNRFKINDGRDGDEKYDDQLIF
jgi:hypothetical protein